MEFLKGRVQRSGKSGWLGRAGCLFVAVYFVVGIIYALVHFNDFGAALPQFSRYIAAPAILALFFTAVGIFAHERWATPCGLYGVSVLTALFLFEGFLTQQRLGVIFGMLGKLDAEQRQLIEEDGALFRGFTLGRINRFSDVDTLPETVLSVPPHSTIMLCSQGDEMITYSADRYGYNNPDEVYDLPVDLLLLGDSFMEGFCLPRGADVASQLREMGLNTVTTGIRGNGPLTELAILGRMGPILRPKQVVMAFFEGNDWENLSRELTLPWLLPALSGDASFGSPVTAQGSMRRAKNVMAKINENQVTSWDLVTQTELLRNFAALQMTGTLLGFTLPKVPHQKPEFRQILRRAVSLTEEWGGTFWLLYIPRVDRYASLLSVDAAYDQLFELVKHAATLEGVEMIDLRSILHDDPDPLSAYAPNAHFSRAGARLVATLVRDRLRNTKDGPDPAPAGAKPH